MRIALTIIVTALGLSVLAGCNSAAEKELAAGERVFLTVDFKASQTLRYRFVSSRDIELDWDPTESASKQGNNKISKSSESMEMVVAYTPIEVDPYGLATIKATCESVKVSRSSPPGRRPVRKDAAAYLAGKTFTLTVGSAGEIEDYSQLDKLLREIGKKAFRPKGKGPRVKEPDMIGDFVATQWFLWDSVSSVKKPAEGLRVGQSWESKLSVPTPMVMRQARNVTYTLDEVRRADMGRLAVIRSSYSPAESAPNSWPIPYSGKFLMSGKFGFLRGYKLLDLQGRGEELFNIDAGRTEQYNQQYRMRIQAYLPGPLGANPQITIRQNLTMQLLEN